MRERGVGQQLEPAQALGIFKRVPHNRVVWLLPAADGSPRAYAVAKRSPARADLANATMSFVSEWRLR